MKKKELKKARIRIRAGYSNVPVVEVLIEVPTTDFRGNPDTQDRCIARIDLDHLEQFIARRVRGGLVKIVDKEPRQKYQRIELI